MTDDNRVSGTEAQRSKTADDASAGEHLEWDLESDEEIHQQMLSAGAYEETPPGTDTADEDNDGSVVSLEN